MRTVDVAYARAHLPELIDQVEAGEEVVIARNDRPMVRLVAVVVPTTRPIFGAMRDVLRPMPFESFASATDEELHELGV